MVTNSIPQTIQQPRQTAVFPHKIISKLAWLYRTLASALATTTARSAVATPDRWRPLDGR